MKPRVPARRRVLSAGNRWLALGAVSTAALVLLVVLSLTGVFNRGSTERDAVAAYIEDVNVTQRGLGIERDRVNKVYQRARTDPQGLAGNVADLDRSVATLRDFDSRLRGLRPPSEAVELHRRLTTLARAEAVFAAEIASLGRYLPALAAERKAVGIAGAALQREVAGRDNASSQATAFYSFASAVETAVKPLQIVAVPTALRPTRSEELARAAELTRTARALAGALRDGDAADAGRLVQAFGVAAAGRGNAVERKAVIAFDAQARRINQFRLKVARERSRLDRLLG